MLSQPYSKIMRLPPFPNVVLDGIVYADYFLTDDDRIISTKKGRWEYLSYFDSKTSKCPLVKIVVQGRTYTSKCAPVPVHRIICETLNPFPIPPGITIEEWNNTPDNIKAILNSTDYWEVNHIDHNTKNYHRWNLEWVTKKINRQKAIIFYKSNGRKWFDKEEYQRGKLPKNTLDHLVA